MKAVIETARNTPSIRVLEGYTASELKVRDGKVVGVSVLPLLPDAPDPPLYLPARAVVMASGGIGQLFSVTTNPEYARGDGLAMAARAGAVIADAEFVQFHPTALDIGRDPAPLASEALRGEGATLINRQGERFMTKVHDDAELAPRDIVARAVHREIEAGRGAWLDCRDAIGARFPERFPLIYQTCQSAGIDPARDLLPVAPAAHYHMGGVLTDANGRTTVNGLWACGEVASTGAHGANRLASNSLLETVVFGARIADDLSGLVAAQRSRAEPESAQAAPGHVENEESGKAIGILREIMTARTGVVRNHEGLATALTDISDLARQNPQSRIIANMALVARFVTAAALVREESRGGHFRNDFPETRDAFKRRSYLTMADVDAIAAEAASGRDLGSNVVHAQFGS
jgi:L-aspartate oxidase